MNKEQDEEFHSDPSNLAKPRSFVSATFAEAPAGNPHIIFQQAGGNICSALGTMFSSALYERSHFIFLGGDRSTSSRHMRACDAARGRMDRCRRGVTRTTRISFVLNQTNDCVTGTQLETAIFTPFCNRCQLGSPSLWTSAACQQIFAYHSSTDCRIIYLLSTIC